jgi:hypothetical protein
MLQLTNQQFERALFLRISTAYQGRKIPYLESQIEYLRKIYPGVSEERLYTLLPEMSRVTAIALAWQTPAEQQGQLTTHTRVLSDENEGVLLQKLVTTLNSFQAKRADAIVGGYGVKRHDIPFLVRRMLLWGIPIPRLLRLHAHKPWEEFALDVSELWSINNGDRAIPLPAFQAVYDPQAPPSYQQFPQPEHLEADLTWLLAHQHRFVNLI